MQPSVRLLAPSVRRSSARAVRRAWRHAACWIALATAASAQVASVTPGASRVHGERLPPSAIGPTRIEAVVVPAAKESAELHDDALTPAPRPIGAPPALQPPSATGALTSGGNAVAPSVGTSLAGPFLFELGNTAIPSDSSLAVGPTHVATVVNRNLCVYLKSTGARVVNTTLQSFFAIPAGMTIGDPRVLYDPHADRFFVSGSNFTNGVWFAVTTTNDPTATWLKTTVVLAQGTDAGRFPDYPTLGVDAQGLYLAALMGGGAPDTVSIFAFDKAPLVAPVPSVGTVTAFRALPNDFAVQPCTTFGTAPGEYLVSRASSTQLRLRRIDAPIAAPTLVELGFVPVASHSPASTAPALGSTTPLDLGDARLMDAVFQAGSVWTAQHVVAGANSAARWYELDPLGVSVVQSGTVSDPTLSFFYPSIAVDAAGDAVLAFSGSSAAQFVAAYACGRRANDPPGTMSAPVLIKAGESAYNRLDGFGRNRWGDYSSTVLDPVASDTFWTFQEYARSANTWGTWIAQLFESAAGDAFCTGDGLDPALTAACPCANLGGTGHGCANSADSSGGLLQTAGSVANDDVVLCGSHMPGVAGSVYLKGDAVESGGVVFGDGVRCAGGTLIRLHAEINSNGASQYPGPGDPTLSARGQTPVGSGLVALYQTYYRNASASFCPPATFNVTNGVRVVW